MVVTTTGSEEEARELARGLVEAHLAACVNIIPKVISVYNWNGETEEDGECLLFVKTRCSLTGQIRAYFGENHPYDIPEFIVLPILEGSQSYLNWMGGWLA
jgi:periplasmic divalent cation tolerance protein